MSAPVVWVATELGRTYVFSGFPWVLLGYSQVTVLPIAQLASVFGVYGVSMLVAAVSAALAMAAAGPASASALRGFGGTRKTGHYVRFAPAALVLAIVLIVAVWGSRRAASSEWTHAGEPIRVGMIQGNVDQAIKWDVTRASTIFQDYLRLTRQAIREGAQLVLWPESSTPFLFEDDPAGAAKVRALAQQAKVSILFGSDQIERGRPDRFYNSAFLVGADGTTGGVYRKMHLVPFGEYVPLKRLLFFVGPVDRQVGGFLSRPEPGTCCPCGGHPVSVAICYEVVYSDLVRRFVAGGSELLTTITNDAWFGPTSAPVPALRAGVDAGHRERALPRAIGQHRHQRDRRSVRPRGGADADLPAGGGRRRGAVSADASTFYASRRRPSPMRRRGDDRGLLVLAPPCK